MAASKLVITVAAATATVGLLASGLASAQTAAQSEPVLKPAKERFAKAPEAAPVASAGMTSQQRLSLCLGSWDAQTHMSRREWRTACQRSVKDYPDAFAR
jgi:hypothetical protein